MESNAVYLYEPHLLLTVISLWMLLIFEYLIISTSKCFDSLIRFIEDPIFRVDRKSTYNLFVLKNGTNFKFRNFFEIKSKIINLVPSFRVNRILQNKYVVFFFYCYFKYFGYVKCENSNNFLLFYCCKNDLHKTIVKLKTTHVYFLHDLPS